MKQGLKSNHIDLYLSFSSSSYKNLTQPTVLLLALTKNLCSTSTFYIGNGWYEHFKPFKYMAKFSCSPRRSTSVKKLSPFQVLSSWTLNSVMTGIWSSHALPKIQLYFRQQLGAPDQFLRAPRQTTLKILTHRSFRRIFKNAKNVAFYK